MDAAFKIVTQLPLTELWRADGSMVASRIRSLTADDVTSLLRAGQIQFVVAEVGASPCWIPLRECYAFWKREVRPHFAAPESGVFLDDFPDGYCYFASEWSSRDGAPIVVCERRH